MKITKFKKLLKNLKCEIKYEIFSYYKIKENKKIDNKDLK